MKINVCYVYWILLLVTFVSSCFLFVLVACEVQPSGFKHIVGNSSDIVHSAGTSADISVKKEPEPSPDEISPSNLVRDEESDAQLALSTKHNRREDAASAVHSSFAEAEAKPSDVIRQSPSDVNMSPEILTEFNNGLTDSGQAVVLTLLESATTELHKQLQTEGLSSSLADALGSDNLTVETPPSPANQMPAVQEAPERENHSRQESNDDLYVTQAEPKVLEVRYNVVDVESIILPGLGGKVIVVADEAKEVESEEEAHSDSEGAAVATGDPPVTPPPDDIPSFSEWSQKKMEEAEKKVLNGSSAGGATPPRPASTSKLRSKNYASPDCGAKIVAANPEAESANSVLSPSRDEYVLNACVNRIWLVVELCEAIQAKKIDIANFELFSSSPKDFSVSVSDRFPSRDWRGVGHFTAQDVRDVQSYDLDPHLFGKFIKVEMHSHYGSEHYCPISLVRVYGTSEFEVLATEVEAHHPTQETEEEVEEGTLEGGDPSGDSPRNLFGSARAVVMSLVKKATEALVKGGDGAAANDTAAPGDGDASRQSACGARWTSTPRHLIVCDNCSDTLYHCVWDMLGHRERELYEFVQVPFVRDALRSGPVCAEYGLDFGRRRPLNYPDRPDPGDYLKSLLPDSYIAALCNALAVIESKVVLNASLESNKTAAANTTDEDSDDPPAPNTEYAGGLLLPPVATCSTLVEPGPPPPPHTTTAAPPEAPPESVASQINPTRTLTEAELDESIFSSTRSPDPVEPPVEPPPPPTVEPSVAPPVDNSTAELEPTRVEESSDPVESFQPEEDPSLDTLLSELKELEGPPAPATSTPPPPQKESVFVRISNRIKALERNMSLSGQYLEELSRRYKRQVEEISRTLNRTLAAAETEARRREEVERRAGEEVETLRAQVATLTEAVDRLTASRDDGWPPGRHAALIAAEVLLFAGVLCLCGGGGRREAVGGGERRWSLPWGKRPAPAPTEVGRRKSVGAGKQPPPKARRKRPSEVALNISGTYTDLLIADPAPAGREAVWTAPRAETKRRRRRKKEAGGLPKSSSSASLQPKTSRKTSTNSSSGGGSAPCGDVRRASLSELGGSFWLPVNGTDGLWTRAQEEEPPQVELLGAHPPGPPPPPPSEEEVPPVNGRSEDSLPGLRESDRYLSLPSFMRTASATRADRRASDVGRHSSQQTGPVPTPAGEERKKPRGFKKMVKRFF